MHGFDEYTLEGSKPVKAWTRGVAFDEKAKAQVLNAARMPFIFKHVAVMPDVHLGIGATVGSVVPTSGAIIPAAVGVDIGCGMMAHQTSLRADQLPDNLASLRGEIERAVPHGFVSVAGRSAKGSWTTPPNSAATRWRGLKSRYDALVDRHPRIGHKSPLSQL